MKCNTNESQWEKSAAWCLADMPKANGCVLISAISLRIILFDGGGGGGGGGEGGGGGGGGGGGDLLRFYRSYLLFI
ncbi:unnamed protein product [Dicrocoelium dendriticum]|nr:unnamed protein product [Dicrocoelium dendriticum]